MSLLGSSTQLRLWAGLLAISLLPLAVQAPMSSGPAAEMRPADWLEAQVQAPGAATLPPDGAGPQRAFDQALAAAKAADTPTLHAFLTTFLHAHARLTSAEVITTEGRSCRALVQHLRRQLTRTGLGLLPPSQAGAPPTAPHRLARLLLAAAGPLVERAAPPSSLMDPAAGRTPPPVFALLRTAAVSPFSGGLIRVLFSGRSLGP